MKVWMEIFVLKKLNGPLVVNKRLIEELKLLLIDLRQRW